MHATAQLSRDGTPAGLVRRAVSGGGRPLEASVRADMEDKLGHSFGDVQVHTGAVPDAAARAIGATAYTSGANVVFRDGHYTPETAAGRRTLAHELTHVVQQRQGAVSGAHGVQGLRISEPGDRFEAEADRVAETVVAGGRAPGSVMAATRPVIQRCGSTPPDQCGCHGGGHGEETIQRQTPPPGGSGAAQGPTVPRPAALPLDQGFELYDVPGLPPEVTAAIPEGKVTTLVPLAVFQGPGSAAQRGTEALAVGARSGLAAANTSLQTFGLPGSGAGQTSVGIVAIPRTNVTAPVTSPQFNFFDPAAPLDYWGHTALYVRQAGKIVAVRGFNPVTGTWAGIVDLVRNFKAVESGAKGAPGVLSSDAYLFTSTAARTLEYPITPEQATRLLGTIPEVGPGGRPGVPLEYTAVPSNYAAGRPGLAQPFCVGSNCGLWAIGQIEEGLGGPVGRPGQGSVTSIGGEGSASQGEVIKLINEASKVREAGGPSPLETPAGAAGPAVATQFPRLLRVLKIGGRVLMVVGLVVGGLEIAFATKEQRPRVIAGVAGGLAGGLILGAGAGLLCAATAPLCLVVAGLTLGFAGGIAGRFLAEKAFDASVNPPQRSAGGKPSDCPNCHESLAPAKADTSWMFNLFEDARKTGSGSQNTLGPADLEVLLRWLGPPPPVGGPAAPR
ncbi:DUF4157 domain-containing protein [Actinomadura sp. 6N118]|uniref:DUF4157 domain-containing protein n=1 Tax=Actinomadura sp. 6N118 TaxID=3375151 RepID=UPI0037AF0E85